MAEQTKKQKTLGIITALNTILERYPKLISFEEENGVETTFTAISFLLDILKMFGVTEEKILEWLTGLIAGVNEGGVEKGILFAINEAIKALLIAYLNGMYDCPIDPVLPDEFLKSPYWDTTDMEACKYVDGIEIPIEEIDAFGLLQNAPTSSGGSVFYFDVDRDYFNSSNVYASQDMNAYLWYIINRGSVYNVRADHRCVWDNRNTYGFKFNDLESAGKSIQKTFVDTECEDSPIRFVTGVGPKKEILLCEFVEDASSIESEQPPIEGVDRLFTTNCLRVYGVYDRYHRDAQKIDVGAGVQIGGKALNKTIYQFNVDYVSSLKLFDAKTLVAQVINAIVGISSSLSFKLSYEKGILYDKIKDVVEQVMNEPDDSDIEFEEYYKFSDEKYSKFVTDATLRYNSEYSTGSETGDLDSVDSNAIYDAISQLRPSMGQEDMEHAVMSALVGVADILSRSGYIDGKDQYSFKLSIISKFINELVVQLAMQILTPKVMLIFAINNRFLGGDKVGTMRSIEEFFKNFWNIIRDCIKRITKMIMDALIDMVIGQIKPIIDLAIKKLLLETIMYYRILLQQILRDCAFIPSLTVNPLFKYGALTIDNVNYADIIPTEKSPKQ